MNKDQKKYLEYKILRILTAPLDDEFIAYIIEELNSQHNFKLLEEINNKKIQAKYGRLL